MASMAANAACTITYSCGDGTGTPPAQHTVPDGNTFTPLANTCTRDGYMFSHYIARANSYSYAMDGIAHPETIYTIPFNGTRTCYNNTTFTLTAQWVPASTAVGANCYCKLTDPSTSATRWVFVGSVDSDYCAESCTMDSTRLVMASRDFRRAVFGLSE